MIATVIVIVLLVTLVTNMASKKTTKTTKKTTSTKKTGKSSSGKKTTKKGSKKTDSPMARLRAMAGFDDLSERGKQTLTTTLDGIASDWEWAEIASQLGMAPSSLHRVICQHLGKLGLIQLPKGAKGKSGTPVSYAARLKALVRLADGLEWPVSKAAPSPAKASTKTETTKDSTQSDTQSDTQSGNGENGRYVPIHDGRYILDTQTGATFKPGDPVPETETQNGKPVPQDQTFIVEYKRDSKSGKTMEYKTPYSKTGTYARMNLGVWAGTKAEVTVKVLENEDIE